MAFKGVKPLQTDKWLIESMIWGSWTSLCRISAEASVKLSRMAVKRQQWLLRLLTMQYCVSSHWDSYRWFISPGSSSFQSFLIWHCISHQTLENRKYISSAAAASFSNQNKSVSFLAFSSQRIQIQVFPQIDAVEERRKKEKRKNRTSLDNVLKSNPLKQIPTLKEIYSTARFENEQESTLKGRSEEWQSSSSHSGRERLMKLQAECRKWMNEWMKEWMWQGPNTV